MGDIKVIRAALGTAAERYEQVAASRSLYDGMVDQIEGLGQDAHADSAMRKAMEARTDLAAALRNAHQVCEAELRLLAQALAESRVLYEQVEAENVQLVKEAKRKFDIKASDSHLRIPEHGGHPRWSESDAAKTAGLAEALPTDFKDAEITMAIINLDHTINYEVPDFLTDGVLKFLTLLNNGQTLERLMDGWLPVYQMGAGTHRLGLAAAHVGVDMWSDRLQLRQAWQGEAGDAAAAVFGSLGSWFQDAGVAIQGVGGGLMTRAASAVLYREQAATFLVKLLGSVKFIVAMAKLWDITRSITEVVTMAELRRWRQFLVAIAGAVRDVYDGVRGLLETSTALWEGAKAILLWLTQAATSGDHRLGIPPAPAWR